MRTITLLILSTFIFSCGEKPSNWENPELSELDYEPNTVLISNFSINGLSCLTNKESLLSTFGEPDTVMERPNLRVSRFDSVDMKYMWFSNRQIQFEIVNDTAIISTIDFRNSNFELRIDGKVLSAETNFKRMKELFPESYAWRNPGLSMISYLMGDETPEEVKDFDWIHISDGKLVREQYGFVELSFINNKLAFLTYSNRWK